MDYQSEATTTDETAVNKALEMKCILVHTLRTQSLPQHIYNEASTGCTGIGPQSIHILLFAEESIEEEDDTIFR